MDNKQVTAEWIAQQREAICVAMSNDDIAGIIDLANVALTAALDALESSMQREAEKDAEISRLTVENADCVQEIKTVTLAQQQEISRLTAERDAAIRDLKWLSNEYKFCTTCKLDNGNGVWDCNDERCDAENHYEWRGMCAENAPEGKT